MKLSKKALLSLVITGALFVGFLVGLSYFRDSNQALGNVEIGGELVATTTGIGAGYPEAVKTFTPTATPVSGMLGSIFFTVPTISRVQVYDATTTNVSLRTGNIASSSLLLADFPAGTGTSTIPLNIRFRYGLTVVFNGTVSTSTITFRANSYQN